MSARNAALAVARTASEEERRRWEGLSQAEMMRRCAAIPERGATPVGRALLALGRTWEAARAEALRRLRASVSPDHFAIFQASVLEELPTEDVMRLYRVSRDNLYQIRKRVKDIFTELLKAALDDLDAPTPPG